jgi:glycosyltransferase involved in cell wall biosynthesis
VADAMSAQYLAAGIGRPGQYTRILSGFDLEPFARAGHNSALRESCGFAPDDFVVGKIARLFKLKGHEDLFEVAPSLVRACPKIRFLLVGDGIWRERFEARARSLGLARHFYFTGLVPPGEVPQWIGAMDALIHLSRREGLPRALPQAMAAARPVVAYDCDGAREVCLDGETGFLVPPGDLECLQERLLRLAGDAALRLRLGLKGATLAAAWFPVEKMVDNIYELYGRLECSTAKAGR